MTATATPVEFDPFSNDFFDDPTETYRRLRDEAPVYFSEQYGFYALSRFADVLAAHRDWEGFSSAHGIELFTLSMDPDEVASYRNLIMMDPPEHDRFRASRSDEFLADKPKFEVVVDERGSLKTLHPFLPDCMCRE